MTENVCVCDRKIERERESETERERAREREFVTGDIESLWDIYYINPPTEPK